MIECDVAVVIYSRGRERCLSRLLRDLREEFVPCLNAAGLSCCVVVYAQGYTSLFLDHLEETVGSGGSANQLLIIRSARLHETIGDVARTTIEAVHQACRYTLAMLIDDDSCYEPDARVAANLQQAALTFIRESHRAYSIKLGNETSLKFEAFVSETAPIMPFREKMLWVSRAVLDEVLLTPQFPELSIGEDAVIAALAWLEDPAACFGVHGMGTFLHLGFERPEDLAACDNEGGYAELMEFTGDKTGTKYDEALRTGITPYHVLPHVFVSEEHPHYEFNGIRIEVARAMLAKLSGWRAPTYPI